MGFHEPGVVVEVGRDQVNTKLINHMDEKYVETIVYDATQAELVRITEQLARPRRGQVSTKLI